MLLADTIYAADVIATDESISAAVIDGQGLYSIVAKNDLTTFFNIKTTNVFILKNLGLNANGHSVQGVFDNEVALTRTTNRANPNISVSSMSSQRSFFENLDIIDVSDLVPATSQRHFQNCEFKDLRIQMSQTSSYFNLAGEADFQFCVYDNCSGDAEIRFILPSDPGSNPSKNNSFKNCNVVGDIASSAVKQNTFIDCTTLSGTVDNATTDLVLNTRPLSQTKANVNPVWNEIPGKLVVSDTIQAGNDLIVTGTLYASSIQGNNNVTLNSGLYVTGSSGFSDVGVKNLTITGSGVNPPNLYYRSHGSFPVLHWWDSIQGTTGNASPQLFFFTPAPTNSAFMAEARVTATNRTNLQDVAAFVIRAHFVNISGTLKRYGQTVDYVDSTTGSAWGCNWRANGQNMCVYVTGSFNTTVDWTVFTKFDGRTWT